MVSVEPFGMQARDRYLSGCETGCGVLTKPFRCGIEQVDIDFGIAVDVPHDAWEVERVREAAT